MYKSEYLFDLAAKKAMVKWYPEHFTLCVHMQRFYLPSKTIRNDLSEVKKRLPIMYRGASVSTIARHAKRPLCRRRKFKKRGRPKVKCLWKHRQVLKKNLCSGVWFCAEDALPWLREKEYSMSLSTLRRLMRQEGLKWRRPVKKPKLTEGHVAKRLEKVRIFSIVWSHYENLLFIDEKKWSLSGPDGCQFGWDSDDERRVIETSKFHSGSVRVVGCFGVGFIMPLLFIADKGFNSRQYSLFLLSVKNTPGWHEGRVLVHDGATYHTSAETADLIRHEGLSVDLLPPNSPDLNPIENMWGVLTRRVYRGGRRFASKETLKARIQEEWLGMVGDEALVRGMTQCIPGRVQRVWAAGGGWPMRGDYRA
jgi:hypothetical protein